MREKDIQQAAAELAAELVRPADNGNGCCLHVCDSFGVYAGGSGFRCTDADAKNLTLDTARAQIANLFALAARNGAEMDRARIDAMLVDREAEALNKASEIDADAEQHRRTANRLAGESAALVVKAADLARLRALASNNGLLPPTAQETMTMFTASDFAPAPPPARQPRAILHPANHATPPGYSSCGQPVEVTVGDLTAEVSVYLHGVHDSDAPNAPRRPVLVMVGQAWTDDAGPALNTAEWAVYSAARPGLAEDLYEAAVDKWTGYDDQLRELRDGGL